MLGAPVFRTALFGPWSGNALWTAARAVPSLDLPFADSKSLVDAITGRQLISYARAGNGTYTDSAGVLRTATTNLLLRSEEFDNVSWSKTGFLAFGSGSIANATTAPDGTLTSDLLTESTALSERTCYQSGFTTTTSATLSCYIKPNGRNFAGLRFYAAGNNWVRVTFTLTGAGSASAIAAGSSSDYSATSASITAAGNNWYRVSLSATRAGGVSYATIDFATSASPTLYAPLGNELYTGDGTSGIYLWGAQLEQSSTVGEYIPTGSTINSAPRFDHNPLTGESLGLLVEEQRTNSIRNNTMVGAVAGTPGTVPTNWGDAPTSNGLNRQIVGIGTQNGITYIDIRYSGTATATASLPLQPELGAVTVAATGQSWTASSWLALAGGSTSGLTVIQRVTGRSSVGGFLENSDTSVALRSTLTRYAASITMANASTLRVSSDIVLSYSSGAAIDITLRIGLPQLEQGATASSVIPTTTTAAATRNADVVSITGTNFSSWYRQDEGTWFAEGKRDGTADGRFLGLSTGSINNTYVLTTNASRTAIISSVSGGSFGGGVTTANSFAYQNPIKLAASISALLNENICLNGGVVATGSTTTPVGTLTTLDIGTQSGAATAFFNGTIRRLTFWPQALPGQLQAITQP